MADYAITASQVLPDTAGEIVWGILGATVTAGQSLYLDSMTNTYKLADTDSTAAVAAMRGVALTGGSTGQPVALQKTGTPTLGAAATITAGAIILLSDTPGGLRPVADIDSGDIVVIAGVGTATNKMVIPGSGPFNSGQVLP